MQRIINLFIISIFFIIAVQSGYADAAADRALAAIAKRIAPVGQVNVEQPAKKILEPAQNISQEPSTPTTKTNGTVATTAAQSSGKTIYENHCQVCHGAGVAGAPKLGDAQAWEQRKQQGVDVLINHVLNGYKAMPKKGGCISCSEADIKAAV